MIIFTSHLCHKDFSILNNLNAIKVLYKPTYFSLYMNKLNIIRQKLTKIYQR